MEYLILIIT